jgi:hypothetical protein
MYNLGTFQRSSVLVSGYVGTHHRSKVRGETQLSYATKETEEGAS